MRINKLTLFIFEFLRDGFYVGIFLLLPFIEKNIPLTLFQAGSLQTTVNILIILLAVPLVSLLIRFGEIRMLLFSLLLFAVGFIGIFFVHSYLSLLALFVVLGTAFSFYATISSYVRVTWFAKETRGKELGQLMALGDIGKLLFSSLTGFSAGFIGWRISSVSLGIITGVIFVILSFFLSITHSFGKSTHAQTKEKHNYLPHSYFLKHKPFVLAVLTISLDEGVNTPFYVFLPFLFIAKGVPLIFIGMFGGLYYGGNILSRLLFGRLVDKVGSAKMLISLELAMACMTVLIALSSSIMWVGILAILLGFITEGTDPATTSMVAESLEHVAYAQRASGIQTIAKGIAKALFPLLLGFIATQLGIFWGFYALAIACLLPIIPAWLFLQEKKRKTLKSAL